MVPYLFIGFASFSLVTGYLLGFRAGYREGYSVGRVIGAIEAMGAFNRRGSVERVDSVTDVREIYRHN